MEKVKVYRTVSGDTWDLIAFKVFGNEKYFHKLIRANLNLIDVSIFSGNVPIIIPEIEMDIKIDNRKLPPWKRG